MADNSIGAVAFIDVTKIEEALGKIDKGTEKIAESMDTMIKVMEKGFTKAGTTASEAGEKIKKAFDPNSFTSVNTAINKLKKDLEGALITEQEFIDKMKELGVDMKNVAYQPNATGKKIKAIPALSEDQSSATANLQYQAGLNIPQLNQAILVLENYRDKIGLTSKEQDRANGLLSVYGKELKTSKMTVEERIAVEVKLANALKKAQQAQKNSTYDGAMGMSSKTIDERIAKLNALKAVRAKTSDADAEGAKKIRNLNQEMYRLDGANKKAIMSGVQIEKQSDKMKNTVEALTRRVAYYASFNMFANFIKQLATVRGEFELQQRSLEAIIRNKEAANKIFTQIQSLAVVSPFQFKELVSYTKQLAAYRVETSKLYDTTKMLADVSAGLGVDMSRLILAYGQTRSASVLRGQELRQYTEAGIPLVQELADKFSELEGRVISTGEVFEKISKRMVGFEMVDEIFQKMTKSGGMFYNMQEIQAETIKGKMSNLIDSYQIMLNKMGTEQEGAIKLALNSMTLLMNNYQILIDLIGAVGIGYGTLILKRLIMKATIGQETMALEKQLLVAKNKVASDLTSLSLTQKLTNQQKALVATRNMLTAADKRNLIINGQLSKNQTLRLLYFGRLNLVQRQLLVTQGLLTQSELVHYSLMNWMGKSWTKTWYVLKAGFLGIGKSLAALATPTNIWMAALMAIGAIAMKLYSNHKKWTEMNEALVKNTREASQDMKKAYQEVADLINKGVGEGENQISGGVFDEQSITRAIIAIQGLANGNETLNVLIKERIGFYASEAERLIAMKKLLDDYILALDNAKKDPKEIAMSYDTGYLGNQGYEKDINDVAETADRLTEAFSKFKGVAGSALDDSREEFIALKEEGLSYATTLEYINRLKKDAFAFQKTQPVRGSRAFDEADNVSSIAIQLSLDLKEAEAEYQRHWDYVKLHTTRFNGDIIKYDEEYYGLGKDKFNAFLVDQKTKFEQWLATTEDKTKQNGDIFRTQLNDQFNSADPIYNKAIGKLQNFLNGEKRIYSTFGGQMVDYNNKVNFGLSKDNLAKFKAEMQEIYKYWISKQDNVTQSMSEWLDKTFNREYTVKFSLIESMNKLKDQDFIGRVNKKIEALKIEFPNVSIPIKTPVEGEGSSQILSQIKTDASEAEERLKQMSNASKGFYTTNEITSAKEEANALIGLAKHVGVYEDKKAESKDKSLEKLKQELKLIDDINKSYSDLEKSGYGKDNIPSLMPANYDKEVQKLFGIGMTAEKIAKMSKEQSIAFMEGLRKGLKTIASKEELDLNIAKLKVEVTKDVIEKASEDLNSSISDIQDGLTLDKDLKGFDSNMREAFKKLFDYKELNIDQALYQLNSSINKELQKIGEKSIDMSKIDLGSVLSQTGIDADSTVGKDLKKAYDLRKKILQDDMNETASNYKKLLDKYDDFGSKQIELSLTKSQELYDLNRRFNTQELQATQEYLSLKNAIEKKYSEESSKLKVEEFKASELWVKTFEDLDRVSTTTIETLMEKLQELMRVELDPKSLKELTVAYNKMRTAIEKRNPFKSLTSGIKEYLKAREEQKKNDEEIKKLEDKVAVGTQTAIDTNADATSGVDDYTEALGKLKEAKEKDAELDNTKEDKAQQMLDSYVKIKKVALEATAILKDVVSATTDTDSYAAELLQDSLNTVEGVAGIGEGVLQIIAGDTAAGVINTAKGLWTTVSTWIDNSNNKIDRAVEKSQQDIEKLSNAYEDLQRAINTAFGAAEIKAKKAAIANLALQKAEVDRQIELEKSRSSSNKDASALAALEKQSHDLAQQMIDDTQELVDTLMDGTLKSNVEKFSDIIVDSMSNATDAVDALNASWADMIKGMISSQFIQPIIAEYVKKAQALVEGYLEDDIITQGEIEDFARNTRMFSNGIEEATAQVQPLIDVATDLASGASNTSTLQKGIQSVTEQTAQALEGLLNTIRFEIYNHSGILNGISDSISISNVIASNLLTVARDGFNLMKEMRLWQESITWTGHNKGGGKGLKVFGYNSEATY